MSAIIRDIYVKLICSCQSSIKKLVNHRNYLPRPKNNYKIFQIPLIILAIISICLTFSLSSFANEANHKEIGISQIIEHTALDTVRKSMLETLKNEGFEQGKNLIVHYENAQGNMVISTQIATKLSGSNIDVAVGISTPSAQTLLQASQKLGKKIPIVFTAVTDPSQAKLTTETTHYPISGVTDAPNLLALIEIFEKVMPNLKRLGILYNPSEANSVSTVTHLKKLLKEKNIVLVEAPVNSTAEVPQATQSLIGRVDALYFPQDNTIVAAMQSVIGVVNQSQPILPIILPIYSDDPKIMDNVLIANGYDYKDIGRETGEMVAQILKGKSITEIPIHSPRFTKTVINTSMLKKLGLTMPKTLKYSKMEIIPNK